MSIYHAARNALFIGDHSIANISRNFVEWHLGRSRFAIWAIDVDTHPIRRQVRAAQAHLSDFLLTGYRRQPHVTLAVCGFPCKMPLRDDDFGIDTLSLQIEKLSQLSVEGLEIGIGRFDSFSSAAFFHVDDREGWLADLRECLTVGAANAEGYTPHLTIGLYGGVRSRAEIFERIEGFEAADLRVRVRRLSLMTYDTSMIQGRLTIVADYDLGSKLLCWRQGREQLFSDLPVEVGAATSGN